MFVYLHQKLDESVMASSAKSILHFLVNVSHSLVIVAVGLLASYILRRLIKRFFQKQQKKFAERNYHTASTVMVSLVRYTAYFLICAQVLAAFGIAPQSILAVAGVGGIAIGLGAQSMVADFLAGITILVENQFRVGDTVEIGGKSGTVETIGLRTTRLRSAGGDVHIFPNSQIQVLTNMSKGFNRAVVDVPVAYSERVEHVLEVLRDEMSRVGVSISGAMQEPEVVGITEMNGRWLVIRITADCQVGENWAIERQVRRLVKVRFEKEGIKQPSPLGWEPDEK